jgi:hypothetical protein
LFVIPDLIRNPTLIRWNDRNVARRSERRQRGLSSAKSRLGGKPMPWWGSGAKEGVDITPTLGVVKTIQRDLKFHLLKNPGF